MAAINYDSAFSGSNTVSVTEIVSGALAALANAFAPIADMIERRRAVAMLNGLTDAQLADMGIARGDIEKVVTAA